MVPSLHSLDSLVKECFTDGLSDEIDGNRKPPYRNDIPSVWNERCELHLLYD